MTWSSFFKCTFASAQMHFFFNSKRGFSSKPEKNNFSLGPAFFFLHIERIKNFSVHVHKKMIFVSIYSLNVFRSGDGMMILTFYSLHLTSFELKKNSYDLFTWMPGKYTMNNAIIALEENKTTKMKKERLDNRNEETTEYHVEQSKTNRWTISVSHRMAIEEI